MKALRRNRPEGGAQLRWRDQVTARRPKDQIAPSSAHWINNINYGSSNSSYNTIYIPWPAQKKRPPRPLPSFSGSFEHFSYSGLHCSRQLPVYKITPNTERREQTRPEKQRGEQNADEMAFMPQVRVSLLTVCTFSFTIGTKGYLTTGLNEIIMMLDREMSYSGARPGQFVFYKPVRISL